MGEKITKAIIDEELKKSYLDYSMSVIVGRALPDVRDGLKPVHRRILFTMHLSGLQHNKPFKKCARIVGSCLGRFHPHGDQAVYDALVRLAQDFSMRYPLIEGQGNFGSIDGDPQAAMRYTEARLHKLGEEMLADIDKETVDFVPNFDASTKEPVVLPAKIPNLLINGTTGIAVGMATSIPPHNIAEVCDALIALIENPNASIEELMQFIKGPDFPTGGIICGIENVKQAYKTGKGKIIVRGKAEIEGRNIIITEIPYMVNKALLVEEIANLVEQGILQGINDIRDESSRKGIRIVIETNSQPEVVLNQLYKHTQLQTTFGIIMLALINNQPKLFNLKDLLNSFLIHRKEIVIRKTKYLLNKAEERVHILEGLKTALANIDNVVSLIKKSKNVEEAKIGLVTNFKLSEKQANAILEMRLQKLTSLEQEKLASEHAELLEKIKNYKEILSSEQKLWQLIKQEILEIKNCYADKRRTTILETIETISEEDLVKEEQVVVTLTNKNYIKRTPLKLYKKQKRGGKGITVVSTKEDDFVKYIAVVNSLDNLLFFTNKGKVYTLKAYKLPEASRYARGKALQNLLPLSQEEDVNAVIAVRNFSHEKYLLMATKHGMIKKTPLKEYETNRRTGIIGIDLKQNDELVSVRITDGKKVILLESSDGKAVVFDELQVRPTARASMGVKGMSLASNASVVSMEVCDGPLVFTVTENGYGKCTKLELYRKISRGSMGVIDIKTNERNGNVIDVKVVNPEDEVILVTKNGSLVRVSIKDVPVIGRNTSGVRLIKLADNDKLVDVCRIKKKKDFTLEGYESVV